MHKSSAVRFEWFLNEYKEYLESISSGIVKILDVGGKNYNGTYEEILSSINYKKDILDIVDGPEVTFVPADPYQWNEIEDETYNLVYSAQAFQHIDYFWLTILEMKRVLKKNGILVIIAPSNRYDGKYPVADWAFNYDGLIALANWAKLEVLDASVAGVPGIDIGTEWDNPLDDAMLIALNGKSKEVEKLPQRRLAFQRRNIDSNVERVRVLMKWLQIYQAKKNTVSKWLKERSISEVNVYGAGGLGGRLIDELAAEDIAVVCVIDKNSPKYIKNYVSCCASEVELDKRVCLTIVTVPFKWCYVEIVDDLKSLGYKDIVLLEDILEECLNSEDSDFSLH